MFRQSIRPVTILIFLLISTSLAFSHSGRTDRYGGHWNRKTNTYHYHQKPTTLPSQLDRTDCKEQRDLSSRNLENN